MSGHPIRKEELLALETMARGQASAVPTDEAILDRLAKLGLIAQRGGRWSLTERGKMDLSRRKQLGRASRPS